MICSFRCCISFGTCRCVKHFLSHLLKLLPIYFQERIYFGSFWRWSRAGTNCRNSRTLPYYLDSVMCMAYWKDIVIKCKAYFPKEKKNGQPSWINGEHHAWKAQCFYVEVWKCIELRADSAIIKYIVEACIPYREIFATASTDRITHFDHTATSCGDSAHQMLKQYMATSMNNLFPCYGKLYLAIDNNLAEQDMSPHRQQMKIFNYAQRTPQGMIFRNTNLKFHILHWIKSTYTWKFRASHEETRKTYALEFFCTVWGSL